MTTSVKFQLQPHDTIII